jgi:pimeloyl-ACP methyl ester carboxylesterase
MSSRAGQFVLGVAVCAGALMTGAPVAAADHQQDGSSLAWKACGDAPNVQCAVLRAPLDYGRPRDGSVKVFVARSPATGTRLGSLFMNFGGPGASIADFVEATGADGFPALNEHFDLIGMDPRGTGQSEPSIDCKVNRRRSTSTRVS